MLTAARDVSVADWFSRSARDWGTVHSMVPPVFEAWARVFHPASLYERGRLGDPAPTDGREVSWSEVAAANGRTMHGAAEWGQLTGSWRIEEQECLWNREPETGQTPGRQALRLASILAAHTGTSDECFFAVWEGWGEGFSGAIHLFTEGTTEAEKERAIEEWEDEQEELAQWGRWVRSAPIFRVPSRGYHLLRGPLADIGGFYGAGRNAPSIWWPEDRAWCVGSDVDLMTTYVGGSAEAIEAIVGDPDLEALEIPAGQDVTWEADTVNPSVGPPS